ncbi:MAG: hypothetical protein ACJ746_15560 [Bryobacteraceae bacterium]
MDDGRLTREQHRQMLELLEQAALHDYPNPERKGCPGQDFLERLANDRASINLDDARLTHVARCSPCYREFVSNRKSARNRSITRRTLLAAGGVAAAGIAVIGVRTSQRQSSEPWVREAIDLSRNQLTRGTDPNPTPASPTINLPAKRLDLMITLPFASPEGDYQVEVLNSVGKQADVHASGRAFLKDGNTLLHVRLDLSSLRPDSYQIGIRRIPYDWVPIPVQVK